MQRSLRSLLSVEVADFTGLMSSKWKAFSNVDSSVHEAFRKLGHVSLKDGTNNAFEQCMPACQPGTTIRNFIS